MTRPRDTQRQKIYASGWTTPNPKPPRLSSYKEVQAYVDSVTSSRWFQSRWGKRYVEVRRKSYGNATGFYGGHICLPKWSWTEHDILHEIAHTLCPPNYAAHGPEFAAIWLTLVEGAVGKVQGSELRKSFAVKRVKYRNGLTVVPKAGTRSVVTKTAVLAKKRAAASKPPSLAQLSEAAWTIRQAAKAGLLGESTKKPRTHALATARLLDLAAQQSPTVRAASMR